jgi:hypothetical protein
VGGSCSATIDDGVNLAITYVSTPAVQSGGASGSASSWFNVTFTVQDAEGYLNLLNRYQPGMIINTSASYGEGAAPAFSSIRTANKPITSTS